MIETSLAGRVAIVTGAGSGIGKAIATEFARNGARVALAGRRAQRLHEVRQQIEAAGGTASVHVTDVGDVEACRRLVRDAAGQYGRLDILINNAVEPAGSTPLVGTSVEEWDRAYAVNVRGPFVLCQEAVPYLKQRPAAHIVNVISVGARRHYPNMGVYNATKHALRAMTIVLSKELRASTSISVHNLDPGGVDTEPMQRLIKGARSDLQGVALIPASELADLALFLVAYRGAGIIDEIAIRRRTADYYCFE